MASDFDEFMSGLESRKAQLPVVDGELAEGWIYGIASDPIKLQRMRELARARNAWVASGAAAAHATEIQRFTLLSTKNSEHVSQAFCCSLSDLAPCSRTSLTHFNVVRLLRPGVFTTRSYQTKR